MTSQPDHLDHDIRGGKSDFLILLTLFSGLGVASKGHHVRDVE